MTDTETDPFAQLLAEALRAGPGSAPWRDAVAQLGANPGASDEYQLLLSAREHLEQGKSFRDIRAGAGFTRKLMQGLEKETKTPDSNGIPTPTIVAVIALVAIIGALAWVGYHMMPRQGTDRASTTELAGTFFPTELANAKFTGVVPPAWHTIGTLPLDAKGGLRPATSSETAGGGIALATPVSPDDSLAFEVQLHLKHPSDNLITQVFVSASSDFSQDRATSSHELLWSLRGKSQQVVLDGNVLPTTAAALTGDTLSIRIIMNRDQAIVESNGQRLWAGAHNLGSTPRTPGVRFIRSAPDAQPTVEIQSVKVLKK